VEVARENGQAREADLIVAIPPHKVRRRECGFNQAGFNQAELLSKRLAKRLKLPHQGILLGRWAAVRGAFATRPGSQVDK
jgi:predicted amidophosphoribosyltransferase